MATVLAEDFEGLSGEAITSGNTAFDDDSIALRASITGESSSAAAQGGVSALFDAGDVVGESAILREFLPQGTANQWCRFYLQRVTLLVQVKIAQMVDAEVRANTDGTFTIVSGLSSATTTVSAGGEWCRVEWSITGADLTGTNELRLFVGSNVHGTVPDETISVTHAEGTFNNAQFGLIAPDDDTRLRFDAFAIDDAAYPGPHPNPSAVPTLRVAETDTATVLTARKTIGGASETDTAQPVTPARAVIIGQAIETDTAQPVTVGTVTVISRAVETDTARPITPARTATIGRAMESDTADVFTSARAVIIGRASETDTARPVAVLLVGHVVTIEQATETDVAFALTVILPARPRPPRARWQFIIGPAAGGHEHSLTEAKSRKLVARLTPNSEASFTIDGRHPEALNVGELATDLHVLWTPKEGTTRILYRGRVGATGDDVDPDTHTLDIASLDYRAVLERRLLWSNSRLVWNDTDQAVIAWELIEQTQTRAGGNLGISRGEGQTTGRLRDRTYEPGDSIGQRIQELSEVIDGFDWDITPASASALHLDVFHPQRGIDRGVVLEYGGLAHAIRREVDPGEYANAVRVTGDESAETPPTAEEREAPDLAVRPEGRWDRVYPYSTITTQGELDERADWQIGVSDVIAPAYDITLRRGGWDGPDHIWVGDTVRIILKSGRLNVDTHLRVTELQIDIPDTGQETVTVTAAAPSPSPHMPRGAGLIRRLRDRDRRLADLERR